MADETAARPMRRAHREIVDRQELRDVIERARVVRVGFTDPEGMAIVPMNYGIEWPADEEGISCTFWLHSASEGRKADAWAKGADVALELDVEHGVTTGDYACAYSYAYESVMAWGRISAVTETAEKRHGLELIMAHMAPGAPVVFSDEAITRVAVWRIDVTRMTGKRREGQALPEDAKHHKDHKDHKAAKKAKKLAKEAAERERKLAKKEARAAEKAERALRKAKKKHAELEAHDERLDEEGRGRELAPEAPVPEAVLKPMAPVSEPVAPASEPATPIPEPAAPASEPVAPASEPAVPISGPAAPKDDEKARKEQAKRVLEGKRCKGCGHHCKLSGPRCGTGKKLRAKYLAKAGLK